MKTKNELIELSYINVDEDPIRPELDLKWRLSSKRKIYGLGADDNVEAIVCVAYTNKIPTTVEEMDWLSQAACQDGQDGEIAVAYTVWSYKKGAGREIINRVRQFLECERTVTKRMITLSPRTPMATNFHIKNGAKQLKINNTTQNFEYELSTKR